MEYHMFLLRTFRGHLANDACGQGVTALYLWVKVATLWFTIS